MNCNSCNCVIKNLSQHNKTDKHCKNNGENLIIKKKYFYEADYQKEYNEYRKIQGNVMKHCPTCDKNIKKYNFNHHKNTQNHIKKSGINYNQDYNFNQVQIEL